MKRLFSIFNALLILLLLVGSESFASNVQVNRGNEVDCFLPYDGMFGGLKTRILFKASELKKAGARAGEIRGLSFKVTNEDSPQNVPLQNFRVRLTNYAGDLLITNQLPSEEGWTLCYGGTNPPASFNPKEANNPWKKIVFTTPFVWNGESNVLIEVAWTNNVSRVVPEGVVGIKTQNERSLYFWDWNDETGEEFENAMVIYDFTLAPISSFDAFPADWTGTSRRPIVKLDCQNFKSDIELDPVSKLYFNFIDLNRMSDAKSFNIRFFRGAQPAEGNVVISPEVNAYISLNGVDYITHPEKLYIPYTQGEGDDIKIFAKIKGKAQADPNYSVPVKVEAGNLTSTISLAANCGTSPFGEYCASSPRNTNNNAIMKLTLKQENNTLIETGAVLNKTTNLTVDEINNKGYKSYVETVAAPTLKAGEEYTLTIDRATLAERLSNHLVYVFIDADRDGALTNKERVVVRRINEGISKINIDFIMPEKVVIAGDGKVLMRVILSAFDIEGPCDEYWSGETEDYAVALAPAVQSNISKVEVLRTGKDPYRPTEKTKVIAGFRVQIDGALDRPAIYKYKFNTAGSVTPEDISNLKLWYLGKSDRLNEGTSTMLGKLETIVAGENTIEVVPEEGKELIPLPSGKNLFAITCDVKENATPGHIIDMNTVAIEFKKKDNSVITKATPNGNTDDSHMIKNPLSGTFFVGGTPTGNPLNYYQNLKDAAYELSLLGANGNVDFAISDDIYLPDGESVIFNPFESRGEQKTKITIYPKDSRRVIKGKNTHPVNITPTLQFYNVDNFVIDGRINKVGEEVGLKIINEGDRGLTTSLFVSGDRKQILKNVVIRNIEFTGAGREQLISSGLFFFDAMVDTVSIKNNIFSGYSNGIYIGGGSQTVKYLKNVTIENNSFGIPDINKSLTMSGIRLFGSSDIKIIKNNFINIVTKFAEQGANGIIADFANSQLEIRNNFFDNIINPKSTRVSAIRIAGRTVTNGLIADNVIHRVIGNSAGEGTNINSGLDIEGCNDFKIYHNAIYLEGNRSEIKGAAADAPAVNNYSTAIFIGENASELDIRNNIFVNKLTHNTEIPEAKCLSIVIENIGSIQKLDNNAYYSGGKFPIMGLFVDDKATLETWISSTNKDKNSVYRDIVFEEKDGYKFGTLDGVSALDDKMLVPAIKDFDGNTDIHGNPRGTIKTIIGVDEFRPIYKFAQQMPAEIDRKCAPFTEKLAVKVEVSGFDDEIVRDITAAEPNFKYSWTKNGIFMANTREKEVIVPADPDAEDQTPKTVIVIDTVNSNEFFAKIENSNIEEPDQFAVNVSLFEIDKMSDICTIKAEGTIRITKQPVEQSELCSDSGVNRISVSTIGTVSGYQWQKLIGNTWTNLENDTKSYLDVTLTNEKYGVGQYRVIIFDGAYDCNQGQIVSNVSTLTAVNPVSDVNLISKVYDLSKEIVLCEGKTLDIKLDRDPVTGIKGNIYGYRWEELVNGQWVTSDLELRPFLSENGFFTEYTEPSQSGSYRLVVVGSDLCNKKETISNVINLRVKPFVHITEQPKSGIICKDKSIVLNVKNQGTAINYQWLKDGILIDPTTNITANNAQLVIDSAQYEDAGHYGVIITMEDCLEDGGNKLYSDAASIIVMNETQITVEPEDVTVIRGKTAKLYMESNAVGRNPDGKNPDYIADYQWYKAYKSGGRTVIEELKDGPKYSGAKANILFIADVLEEDVVNTVYYVKVQGACGLPLQSRSAKINIADFAFTKLLENIAACEGDTVKLETKSESPIADDEISYEWHFISDDNDMVVGTNSETLAFTANQKMAGKYYVIAKLVKQGTTIKSNVVNVKINVKPYITRDLREEEADENELFTLSVEASGNDLQYRWYRNDQVIPNAFSSSLTISEKKAGMYKYKVMVSNSCGSVKSEVTVTIAQAISKVEEEAETGFTVSNIVPNPVVSNEAKFSVSSELGGNAEISIVDAAGRTQKFFSGNIAGTKNFTINTSKYANGAYFIVITIDGKKITRRFVVEK